MGKSVESFTNVIVAPLVLETEETTRVDRCFGGSEGMGLGIRYDTQGKSVSEVIDDMVAIGTHTPLATLYKDTEETLPCSSLPSAL